ncbi:RagB/SusD family nutrient uptake outer membrane protein [Pedobacter sp. MC2016-14]|uniref:RagB/SusD family nutrient uptake outer membrane protein n=1 Tax=Pedobacter sp. MC2016-14 TaxID=2897327 RepID=UPI001E65C5FC|nr:RagB/SusD family nutrient uptake outer membrane protein [Pedobacter sp. MC2016-14]MCD0488329.1 RagB/SusD family nutrient uptake outer membrane protein [Pedobacter sp. MC2016-14]
MKTQYFALLLLVITLSSCKKDLLEKLPQDALSPEVFYSDAASLRPGLFGVYTSLREGAVFGNPIELEGISDNAILNTRAAEFINFSKGTGGTDNHEKLSEYYLYNYQVIQRANALLDNIEAPGDMVIAERNTIQSEARVLRALAYMRLSYLYGRVPLVTTSISRTEALSLKQASHAELVRFITTELKDAGDKLDTKPYAAQKGRITRQAALGMRAKVLIYEARMGNGSWADALAAITEVKTLALSAGAKLLTTGDGTNGQNNYAALFLEANEDNAEILFQVKFDATVGQGQSLNNNYAPNQANQTGRISVHTNFTTDFYGTDGLAITAAGSVYNPAQPYVNRDPRLLASVYLPGLSYFFGTYTGHAGNASVETDFAVKKYTYADLTTVDRGLDVIVLRYADVLLMLAEAENEVNGPTTTAYNAINEVRARVKMPNVSLGLLAPAFKEEVLHERRVELGFEGQRWFDLVTLGIADTRINGIKELGRKFIPAKQELFPIPKSEIDLNNNLTQNPGY